MSSKLPNAAAKQRTEYRTPVKLFFEPIAAREGLGGAAALSVDHSCVCPLAVCISVDMAPDYSRYIRRTFSHLVLKMPTSHIRGIDMSVTVHLDPIFNVESEKTSPESCRHNPEKL